MEKELNTTKTVLFHMKAIGNVENMTEKARFIIPRGRKFTAVNGIMGILLRDFIPSRFCA